MVVCSATICNEASSIIPCASSVEAVVGAADLTAEAEEEADDDITTTPDRLKQAGKTNNHHRLGAQNTKILLNQAVSHALKHGNYKS
ncbi:hypothetical protein B5J92_00750 [Moraxella atlantae]|uniref:Uncharacterized protein n=1 Tax=Faucicola atlantae TaxID=34059 RepID=A0A1B8QJL0_9GAMM|nr:hypothetical protein A9306_05165 [Moraxella atlantae]OPH37545.1 hypothetical protein B5J92_00750 [Moraxella atlantae]